MTQEGFAIIYRHYDADHGSFLSGTGSRGSVLFPLGVWSSASKIAAFWARFLTSLVNLESFTAYCKDMTNKKRRAKRNKTDVGTVASKNRVSLRRNSNLTTKSSMAIPTIKYTAEYSSRSFRRRTSSTMRARKAILAVKAKIFKFGVMASLSVF